MSHFLVIEKEQEIEDCNFNYLFYVVISFVYAGFLCVLVDRILDSEGLEKNCSYKNIIKYDTAEYTARTEKCTKLKKEFENKKFVYLMALGVLSIIGGISAARASPEYCTGGAGIAVGGMLVIFYETLINWYDLRTDAKILMLGVSLIALFYGSTKYYL
jgi:hypothetical protein